MAPEDLAPNLTTSSDRVMIACRDGSERLTCVFGVRLTGPGSETAEISGDLGVGRDEVRGGVRIRRLGAGEHGNQPDLDEYVSGRDELGRRGEAVRDAARKRAV